jgi:hypothetical protein
MVASSQSGAAAAAAAAVAAAAAAAALAGCAEPIICCTLTFFELNAIIDFLKAPLTGFQRSKKPLQVESQDRWGIAPYRKSRLSLVDHLRRTWISSVPAVAPQAQGQHRLLLC